MADSSYDKGFRDGYYAGLDECGPITGLTGFFKRRGKLKKLSKMKEGERVAVITEALSEHEAGERQAKKRYANPKPRSKSRSKQRSTPSVSTLVRKALQ